MPVATAPPLVGLPSLTAAEAGINVIVQRELRII
jgi:hypothetical protein